jgi:hypothetical protein
VGPEKEEAMLDAILTIGAWALIGIAIYFWGRWSKLERELFANGHGKWEHLE